MNSAILGSDRMGNKMEDIPVVFTVYTDGHGRNNGIHR